MTDSEKDFKDTVTVMVLAHALVEAVDKLNVNRVYKQQMKNRGKSFIAEVDKFLDAAYGKGGETERNLIDLIDKCQNSVQTILDNEVEITN